MKLNTIFKVLSIVLIATPSFYSYAQTSKSTLSLEQLKQELSQLKNDYQQKIAALEERLNAAELETEETQESIETLEIDISQQTNQSSANTFNPSIGLILNGRFVHYNHDAEYILPGFFLGEESGSGEQGLQLGEAELNMSANVDDKFFASATIAFGDGEASVEEAYIQTTNLDNGFNIKAGRFFSDVGYLANKHIHSDNFANRPLPYQAFLGGQFGDVGIQTTWLAPTELYWESGVELYRGDSLPASGAGNSGAGMWTIFTHVGGDFNYAQSWRVGLSYLHADVNDRESHAGDLFSGDSDLWIADFIYKWSPDGNRSEQEFSIQGEYLSRNEKGYFTDARQVLDNEKINRDQDGWYVEGVYKFSRQWRIGLRTSKLNSNELPDQFTGSFLDTLEHSPTEHTFMLDWSNSEFSRIRLQMESSNFNGERSNLWLLQYIAAFGAHGSHSF